MAVLAVIVGHSLLFRFAPMPDPINRAAGSLAVTGVEIFFLISGYVITMLLLKESEAGSVDLRAFYVRRITRIFPPFYAYLATVSLLTLVGYIAAPRADVAASASFLCNTGLPCSWFVGHSWSLAVEEQFYLVWPALFILLASRRLAFLVAAIACLAAFSLARGFVPFANNMSFLYIAIGCLVACSNRIQSWIVGTIGLWRWLVLGVALLLGVLFIPDRAMLAIKPALLTLLVFGAANVRLVSVVLTHPLAQLIGKMSYSLYLWQELFLGRPDAYAGMAPPIVLLPLVAWLSWRYIERPGIAAGKCYTLRRRVEGEGVERAGLATTV